MDATLWMFIPGIVGGVVFAVVLRALGRRTASRPSRDAFADRGDVINFTSIRVAGIGGLGLLGLATAQGDSSGGGVGLTQGDGAHAPMIGT